MCSQAALALGSRHHMPGIVSAEMCRADEGESQCQPVGAHVQRSCIPPSCRSSEERLAVRMHRQAGHV